MSDTKREVIDLYMERAREAQRVAQLNLDHDFYTAYINRAYYAIFYAA